MQSKYQTVVAFHPLDHHPYRHQLSKRKTRFRRSWKGRENRQITSSCLRGQKWKKSWLIAP